MPHLKRGCARKRAASSGRQLKTVLLLGGSQLGSNFFSEVVDRLLDAFAYFEVGERNDFSTGFLGQFANLDFRVLDERLLNQARFSQELADTAFDHVFNNVFWLAGDLVSIEGQEHALLTLDRFSGNFRWQQEFRVGRRYVHGDVFGQLNAAAFKGNHNTDLVAVQVTTNNITFNASQATDVDVFANLADQNQACLLYTSPSPRD